MDRLFTFMQTYRSGILLFIFSLAAFVALVQWFAWIFGFGRFKDYEFSEDKPIRVVIADFVSKIIYEFRHLLALLIVLMFFFALAYSLIKAGSLPTGPDSPSTVDNMKNALQAVVATLGGLVGSIIGYYFGESSAKASPSTDNVAMKPTPEIQDLPPSSQGSEEIQAAPAPPGQENPE